MKAYQSGAPSSWITGFQIPAVLWAVIVFPPAILLLAVADSLSGRCFATLMSLLAVVPLAITIAYVKRSKCWWVSVGIALFGVLALTVAAAVLNPVREGGSEGRVTDEYFANAGFRRFGLSALIPEGDQLQAVFTLMPMADPLFTAKQAHDLKGMTREIYRELENDRDFHALGSAMRFAYDDILVGAGSGTHAFVYVPAALNRDKPQPVLVFFHGSGGNFKAYLWVLSKLADRLGFVLVAPSGGVGNWTKAESEHCLEIALAAAERRAKIDRGAIHLIGLSNGGKAVSYLGQQQGAKFCSLIFVSPVLEDEAIRSPAFANQCRDCSIVAISGGRDDRVPIYYVEGKISQMARMGLAAKLKTIEAADHFLMFSHQTEMLQILYAHFAESASGAADRR